MLNVRVGAELGVFLPSHELTPPVLSGEKAKLREEVLRRRAALGVAARTDASRRILERLRSQPAFQAAHGVHCFVSMAEEVDTAAIFEACWAAGKKTFVPYRIPGRRELGAAPRRKGDPLTKGPFGVPEPPEHLRDPVTPEEIDLVLVPGVAFDREGGRLGYGKGYYDNFLGYLARNVVKRDRKGSAPQGRSIVSLAFAVQIVRSIPSEPWDVPIPLILTEEETIITG